MDFIHLHNHTDYSILDGAITTDRLIKKAIELSMPGIAITDHGNMFGAIDFYQKARKAGIMPIIGEEFYVAPGSRKERGTGRGGDEDSAYHLILLANSVKGYHNLMKLSSIGYTEGFYYKPRIDMEVLERHTEGLICSSACLAGQIPQYILRGRTREARELAGRYAELFGPERFYLEMQDHGIREQQTVNRELITMAAELALPLVATNDAHYVDRDDAHSHEVLLCVQTGKTMLDRERMRFPSSEFYLKSADEMHRLFAECPDALYNTRRIFDMIDLTLDLGKPILPNFQVPPNYDLDSYLRHLVKEGAHRRFGAEVPKAVLDRIEYELTVIINMHFAGYFLIVWDVITHSRATGIPVGPGRGSAAGSMVSYCLGITALDPLRYDLLFERFLNPERNELPDMDLDFCADRREEVIEYVKQRYGEDHVSQIITFNKLKSKAVVKDVARVLDIPFARANEISKFIDEKDLATAVKGSKELQEISRDPEVGKELIEISLRLEGLVRSAGKHPAGIVISRGPLTDYVPLYRDKDGTFSSQYEKDTLEKAGLVKMDFLGLKNLSIIDRCLKLIKELTGTDLDIETIPLDDTPTFSLLQRADTKGVFQLESSGMQNLLRRLGPTVFEDIIAVVALYRPGPLNSGMADSFILRKRNPALVDYPHAVLEPILADTLGVIIYQEQVMRISQVLAGFTMPEADKLRKAMGKKLDAIIEEMRPKFTEGAVKLGYDRKMADELYGAIAKFGEYGFNKSHSAAYALVSYQTAYLKANYPLQYMTALLTAAIDKTDDVIQYVNDCRASGIPVLPPSINESDFDFTIVGTSIRFGLGAIKGAGAKAIESIIRGRRHIGGYGSLRDFFENIDTMTVNKGVLEAMVKAGAMDGLHPNRAQFVASIDQLLDAGKRMQEDRDSGQGSLFGAGDHAASGGVPIEFVPVEEWSDNDRLAFEKEVLGLYLSGHPLAKYEKEIRLFSSVPLSNLTADFNGKNVSIVGIFTNVQIRKAQKTGKKYATATLEDLEGSVDAIMFAKALNEHEEMILSGRPLMVQGVLEAESDSAKKLIVMSVKSLREVRQEAVSALHIKLETMGVDDWMIQSLERVLVRHKGNCPIYFHVNADEGEKIIKVHPSFNIKPSDKLVKDLAQIVGPQSIGYSIGQQ